MSFGQDRELAGPTSVTWHDMTCLCLTGPRATQRTLSSVVKTSGSIHHSISSPLPAPWDHPRSSSGCPKPQCGGAWIRKISVRGQSTISLTNPQTVSVERFTVNLNVQKPRSWQEHNFKGKILRKTPKTQHVHYFGEKLVKFLLCCFLTLVKSGEYQ